MLRVILSLCLFGELLFLGQIAVGQIAGAQDAGAQEASVAPIQRGRASGANEIYKQRIEANWFDGDSKFWYRNNLAEGAREFIAVNAIAGSREPAFDHAAVAAALATELGRDVDAQRLPIDRLEFKASDGTLLMRGRDGDWQWNSATKQLTKPEPAKLEAGATGGARVGLRPEAELRGSSRTGRDSEITFDNRTSDAVAIFWIDPNNQPQPYGQVEAKSRRPQHTFSGHRWLVESLQGDRLAVFEATDEADVALIDGTKLDVRAAGRRRRPRGAGGPAVSDLSPNG